MLLLFFFLQVDSFNHVTLFLFTYFPPECPSMELDFVDPVVFLCMAQLMIGDFFIGFFHRCLLGALCTSKNT